MIELCVKITKSSIRSVWLGHKYAFVFCRVALSENKLENNQQRTVIKSFSYWHFKNRAGQDLNKKELCYVWKVCFREQFSEQLILRKPLWGRFSEFSGIVIRKRFIRKDVSQKFARKCLSWSFSVKYGWCWKECCPLHTFVNH